MTVASQSADSASPPRDRREAILVAALRVIGQGGIDSMTHRKVAAQAGVPLGSITYYFESREALLRAAFVHHMTGVGRRVRTMSENVGDATVEDLVDSMVELAVHYDDPVLTRAEYEMLVYANREDALASEVVAWHQAMDAGFAEWIERAGLPKPMAAARALRGALRGFELERLSNRAVGFDELRRRLSLTFAGLLAAENQDA